MFINVVITKLKEYENEIHAYTEADKNYYDMGNFIVEHFFNQWKSKLYLQFALLILHKFRIL